MIRNFNTQGSTTFSTPHRHFGLFSDWEDSKIQRQLSYIAQKCGNTVDPLSGGRIDPKLGIWIYKPSAVDNLSDQPICFQLYPLYHHILSTINNEGNAWIPDLTGNGKIQLGWNEVKEIHDNYETFQQHGTLMMPKQLVKKTTSHRKRKAIEL